ncbi:MAG: ABC transporter ATP-binding protein [Thermodesulfobacteriota bacterium]
MSEIRIQNLNKTFDKGAVKAIDNLSLTIREGSIVALLGPSGCGKTTTLRCVGGLELPDSGKIFFGERLVCCPDEKVYVPPEKRGLGMVFQSYAIWPHMNVFENVAFPLRRQKIDKEEIRKKVMEALELVGLAGLESRYPTKMSGGQQQRVAFARAIAPRPEALLFDEPLSNLDAKLREKMRFDIVALQKSTHITTIYVTHDQAEAMVIADKIAVMNQGVIEQIGTAREIYDQPGSRFVAGFIGLTNFARGRIASKGSGQQEWLVDSKELGTRIVGISDKDFKPDQKVTLSVRPENIMLSREQPEGDLNIVGGRIERTTYIGEYSDILIRVNAVELRVHSPTHLRFDQGDHVFLAFPPQRCNLLAR